MSQRLALIWMLTLLAGCPAPDPAADLSVAPDLAVDQMSPGDLESSPGDLESSPADLRAASLALGASCEHDAECTSGVCADGVCCNVACGGCMACNLPGSAGTCHAVADGTDPHGACTQPCAAACHAGSCAPAASGTVCKRTCSDGAQSSTLSAQACNGTSLDCTGPMSNASCGEYACGSPTACAPSCVLDGDCIKGYFCKAQQCVPAQANGAACTRPSQCGSNVCNGTCQECAYNYHCTDPRKPVCNGGTCDKCIVDVAGRGTCYSGGEVECTMSSQCSRAFGPTCNPPFTYDCMCGNHTWCPPGTYCSGTGASASCLVVAGQPCHTNAECLSGACVNKACATHGTGLACLTGQECTSGVCNGDQSCQ